MYRGALYRGALYSLFCTGGFVQGGTVQGGLFCQLWQTSVAASQSRGDCTDTVQGLGTVQEGQSFLYREALYRWICTGGHCTGRTFLPTLANKCDSLFCTGGHCTGGHCTVFSVQGNTVLGALYRGALYSLPLSCSIVVGGGGKVGGDII